MYPTVLIRYILSDLCHNTSKTCKNGKVTHYNKASALERVADFSAQGSILALVVVLCDISLLRIIQVISRSNILINVRLLGGIVRVVIPIFTIILL